MPHSLFGRPQPPIFLRDEMEKTGMNPWNTALARRKEERNGGGARHRPQSRNYSAPRLLYHQIQNGELMAGGSPE